MVSNILPKNMELRPMSEDDVGSVLETIRLCDEEEAKIAGEVFEEEGWEGQYVLTEDGIVKGVTGIEYIDGTDNSYWLLRSFLVPQLRERGLASSMTQELLGILNEMDARKVFVNTGDSSDAEIAAEYVIARNEMTKQSPKPGCSHYDYSFPPAIQFILFGRLRLLSWVFSSSYLRLP